MPIEFKVPTDLVKLLDGGALDGDEVWVQYLCQTGEDGSHDPDEPPDDRVRPSHAAFHGKVFRVGEAPVPPLDYGCRCAIRYVAKPDSDAAQVIEVEAEGAEPTTPQDATTEWLDKNVPKWGELKAIAESSPPSEAIGKVQEAAKLMGVEKPRAIAEMVVDSSSAGPSGPTPPIVPSPSPTPAPAPVLPALVGAGGATATQTQLAVELAPIIRKWVAPESLAKIVEVQKPTLLEEGIANEDDFIESAYGLEQSLSKTQTQAIKNFTDLGFIPIRQVDAGLTYEQYLMRNQIHRGDDLSLMRFNNSKRQADAINSAFDSEDVPKFEGTVYRGLGGLSEDTVVQMLQNPEVRLDAMSSATVDPAQAIGFAHKATQYNEGGNVNVVFKIQKAKGMAISSVSESQGEAEVLLRKGSKFLMSRVERFKDNGNRIIMITLEAQ